MAGQGMGDIDSHAGRPAGLFHIIGVLIVVIPLSTWLFQLTGKIYLGAMTSAALVSWMFASSQVIAPIPI
jgi:hypothetical protein